MQRLGVVVAAEEGAEVSRADDPDGEGHHVVPERQVLARRHRGPVAGQLRADGVDLGGHSTYDIRVHIKIRQDGRTSNHFNWLALLRI